MSQDIAATLAAMQAQIASLQEENARLKVQPKTSKALSIKVSEKGAISVYGLNTRFPVSLYREQWLKLLSEDMRKAFDEFLAENKAVLDRIQASHDAKKANPVK